MIFCRAKRAQSKYQRWPPSLKKIKFCDFQMIWPCRKPLTQVKLALVFENRNPTFPKCWRLRMLCLKVERNISNIKLLVFKYVISKQLHNHYLVLIKFQQFFGNILTMLWCLLNCLFVQKYKNLSKKMFLIYRLSVCLAISLKKVTYNLLKKKLGGSTKWPK